MPHTLLFRTEPADTLFECGLTVPSYTLSQNCMDEDNKEIDFLSPDWQRLKSPGEVDAFMLYLWECKLSQLFWRALWRHRSKILARRAIRVFSYTFWNSSYRNKSSGLQKVQSKDDHYRKGIKREIKALRPISRD